jgi:hypothetical protein
MNSVLGHFLAQHRQLRTECIVRFATLHFAEVGDTLAEITDSQAGICLRELTFVVYVY